MNIVKYVTKKINTNNVLENLVSAAESAFVSGGSTAAMSHEGNTIVKSAEAIIATPKDAKETIENLRKINAAATKLISTAKERSQNEPNKNKKLSIKSNVQNVVNALNSLTQTARSVVVSQPETVQALVNVATDLKNNVQELESAMHVDGTIEQDSVEPEVAQDLAAVTRSLAVAARDMIGASVGVAANATSVSAGQAFEESTKKVASSLSELIKVTGALNPGVKECEAAIEEIEKASSKLDLATFDAAAGKLSRDGPYQQYQSESSEIAKKVAQDIQNLFNSAGGSSTQLKQNAIALRESVPLLANSIEETASAAPDLDTQTKLLSTTKQLADNTIKLIKDIQSVNLSDQDSVTRMVKLSNQAQDDIAILLSELSSGADLPQDLDRECNNIKTALQQLGTPVPAASSYSECRDQLSSSTKDTVNAVTHFFNIDKRNVGQVSLAAARISEVLSKLIMAARVSSATTKETDAKRGLLESTKQLGIAVIYLIQDVKMMSSGQDVQSKYEKDFQAVNQATSQLLAASKKGAVGEMLIETAIKGITTQITNLNTAAIFAQAGQLEEKKINYNDFSRFAESNYIRL